MMRRIAATLILFHVWFLCLAQVLGQTPCPTAGIFPSSGLTITNYTISGSFLTYTSISTTAVPATQLTLAILANTSNSIKFTVIGNVDSVTELQITLSPTLNLSCPNITLSIQLHTPLFFRPSIQGTFNRGSPGAIITLRGCFPNNCGDGSTNYTISVAGSPIAFSPVTTPTAGTYMGRLSNYEFSAMTQVNVQVVTPLNTFVESSTTFTFTLRPRGRITAVSPSQGQRGTLVTITGTNLLGIEALSGFATPAISSVTFGGIPASVISSSDTSIVVQVNSGTPGGPYDILINTTQGTFSGPYTSLLAAWTQLPDGVITSIVPPSAEPGTNVTLCGQRLLGNGTYFSSVMFAGLQSPAFGNFFRVNETECLVATTPNVLQSLLPLSGLIVLQSDTMVIVESLSVFRFAGIVSVSPSQGQQGTVVIISGYELLSGYNVTPTVYLNKYPATVKSYNSTHITVIAPVPTNSSLNQIGGVAINTNSYYTVSCDNCWTFLDPGVITGATPTSGVPSLIVTWGGGLVYAFIACAFMHV